MDNFFPHNLIGWLTVLSTLIPAVWFVIKITFVRSFDSLNQTMKQLQQSLMSYDSRIDDHEVRLRLLEFQENQEKDNKDE